MIQYRNLAGQNPRLNAFAIDITLLLINSRLFAVHDGQVIRTVSIGMFPPWHIIIALANELFDHRYLTLALTGRLEGASCESSRLVL